MNSDQTIGLTWVTILGFLRLSTKRAVYDKPLSITQAEVNVRAWLAQPNVRILEPGNRHTEILFDLLRDLGTAGNLATDAHIAALALEWNGTVYSSDSDFSRWPQVRWVNPVAR